MRFLKGVILLSAVSVGVTVFYVFGGLVGFWGEIRSSVLVRDGGKSPNVWPRAEDGDGGASAYQRAKEKGVMDEPTGRVNPPTKGKKTVPRPARARRQAASR